MSDVIAIIPARYGSTRFPGKALADRTGRPLIQHVYEQARQARALSQVMVATDDVRIEQAVRGFGGTAVMTRPDHPNGTSRLAEAAETISAASGDPVIVNVQGDEPEIEPAHIDMAVEAFLGSEDDRTRMGTLAAPFQPDEDPHNTNIVKVVLDRQGRALYFSRAPIPHVRDPEEHTSIEVLKHVGLYVYRRSFLAEYARWIPTPLEQAEQLEQLRVLENGFAVVAARVEAVHHGIDTPDQYDEFVTRWKQQHG
ncbi:MAG: 3-deoxy-manno-octulosonate cytidylyltransferase [Planctomycetes bacterium]|nr:3-deoxy-manno-octulosonate cytidylyltransferase [Planctomycetota bacterium]NOG54867.1 3-deoxy-manno-octulosonate cytidylyltransferase [Planctomycetota bacterium]